MKPILGAAAAAILATMMAAPVMAQTATNPNIPGFNPRHPEQSMEEAVPGMPAHNLRYGKHHPYVERFDPYLKANPGVAADLNRNPRLVDNRSYLHKHPDFAEYLKKHPEVRRHFRSNPRAFMQRENRYER